MAQQLPLDHRAALAEIEKCGGASNWTPEGDKLDILVTLAETYEERRAGRSGVGVGSAPDPSTIPSRVALRHSDVGKTMDYMLKRWANFVRFLDDGRICLTSNAAERALPRPQVLAVAGSDRGGERAAVISTTSTRRPGSPTCSPA